MKKQINMQLSEKDLRRFEKIKQTYDLQNNSEMIRILIKQEFDQIMKYKEMIEI